ncbi:1-phosphatidylinositol-3-phosphate 5-kinase FAB1B isoform X2 [Rhodamnia argentea]|uniref:1-phosphatidylinositol-3-phosphate 5-kinase n=1 Tax=Rhodamnia argentea TaxID=178133 RepID=A0ABM3HRI5_9MYRT|nr:1-phosphatidylinositol-3-phosphate 5-kinase FAB1B isoform X2 [Rhodamnia argentea]
MDAPDKTFSEFFAIIKSWIPWRSEPANVSRDFWMPDQSCRVCYDCDSQFNIINRRHHCRLCGRVFCGKCTANSVPATSTDYKASCDEWERIRVCNYCFKQWEQNLESTNNGDELPNQDFSPSPSATSFVSSKSVNTTNSGSITLGSMSQSLEPYRFVRQSSDLSSNQLSMVEECADRQGVVTSGKCKNDVVDFANHGAPYPNHYGFSMNRSDDDEDQHDLYQSDSETRHLPVENHTDSQVNLHGLGNTADSYEVDLHRVQVETEGSSVSPLHESFDSQGSNEVPQLHKKDEHLISDECEVESSLYPAEDVTSDAVDFENNGLLWLPPEPEDEEDEKERLLFDDDDDDEGDAAGEWGYLHTSGSFGSGEYRAKDRSGEEHKKVMKDVVYGHFRALIAQLLQVENLHTDEENSEDGWLEIISSLSWEAATLLKPDMSKTGGMDPGGYVKVKCIASGHRRQSMVVKGVVCKKNVAHRRMTSKIEKPRILILGGALEYQRVSNLLSSFDTLLRQEMEYLKMAVAKIDAQHPDVLLVENSVSRYALEYLLAKDISLVLNIKRPLLERIARCIGAQIIPSIDSLSAQKLGYCDKFHVERFLEEPDTAGQGGKKLTKTLMYFEGCPKPLGFTILLRGANGDELKKVKHVVQYGVFAAYHLALETSFLADERASLPELPLKSPITVALPDKSLSIERSISTIPGFMVPSNEKPQGSEAGAEPHRSNSVPSSIVSPLTSGSTAKNLEMAFSACFADGSGNLSANLINSINSFMSAPSWRKVDSDSHDSLFTLYGVSGIPEQTISEESSASNIDHPVQGDHLTDAPPIRDMESALLQQENKNLVVESGTSKEEFPPSPSDHQSILVSLSSRCVWKGTVCERSHLFRIKYYGSFDKPLGRFLRDHLFDQNYRCDQCEMPSEAHIQCYTHRQGTLTISVKKLPEILLPGERDGKIWMWHRCLQCPRSNGFPPATRRVVMSDAAWGLSFGKFLELSFSNHAAASRVASCGHSLHRDCLRFYGFGNMVACFRYASIDVHSVYLPPSKLDFSRENQEWIQKEADEVVDRAELLFSEVLNTLSQFEEKRYIEGHVPSSSELRRRIVELEGMLQQEKAEFEESLQKTLKRDVTKGQDVIDILEINRLRRRLLIQSFIWDHRLVYVSGLSSNADDGLRSLSSEEKETSFHKDETPSEVNVGPKDETVVGNSQSFRLDDRNTSLEGGFECQSEQSGDVGQDNQMGKSASSREQKQAEVPANTNASDQSESLESGTNVRRTLSEGQFPTPHNLSETLDAAWTGKNQSNMAVKKEISSVRSDSAIIDSLKGEAVAEGLGVNGYAEDLSKLKVSNSLPPFSSPKDYDDAIESVSWLGVPISIYGSFNKNILAGSQKLNMLGEYHPIYISSFRESELNGGARLLLPVGINDTVVPVYDDEPTSMIAYALVSSDYHTQLCDEAERVKDAEPVAALSSLDSMSFHSFQSFDDMTSESRSLGSGEDSMLSVSGSRSSLGLDMLSFSGSRSSQGLDPLSYTKALHAKISFSDDGQVKYSVTCYYAKRFEALRRMCCPSEMDFVRSLSRCKKWGAQGGKSNVFFAKTLDDRFIIKQVTKTELESFIKFAPAYFKYISESIGTGSPTCLAKILGIYQVTAKHVKGGKETKKDLLIMENLLYGRKVTRLYDLKGSSRSRYNPDSSGSNQVLLDQNLIEAMRTSPIFVGNKAKRLLERAVWNDTSFLALVDVMDYSLLVGVDEEKHELVLGIIDFMRQYTWDKHLETWVKASGILGGPKNESPTVISPKQYKKRFRKAMTTYFLMVPDQWSPATIIPSRSQSDLQEEDAQMALQ